jgi:hypothetical protein
MRFLSIAAVLLITATTACMTGSDELTGDDPELVDEAELLDEEVAEEPGSTTVIEAGTAVLPFGKYVSNTSKEWALSMLKLVPGEGDLRWFVRNSNHTGRGSGEFTLARNQTTGVRYIKFWKYNADGDRVVMDKYAYKVTYVSPTAVDIKLTHEPTATAFTMSGTVYSF